MMSYGPLARFFTVHFFDGLYSRPYTKPCATNSRLKHFHYNRDIHVHHRGMAAMVDSIIRPSVIHSIAVAGAHVGFTSPHPKPNMLKSKLQDCIRKTQFIMCELSHV